MALSESYVITEPEEILPDLNDLDLSREAAEIIRTLPKQIRISVIEGFRKYLTTRKVDNSLGSPVRDLFSGSQMLSWPLGSSNLTEAIYRRDKFDNAFDKYIVECPSGRATADRFRIVVDSSIKILNGSDNKIIWSLGSGPGTDMLEVLKRVPGSTGVGFEFDPVAISMGVAMAEKEKLSNRVEFIEGDFTQKLKHFPKPGLVTIVGIICPWTIKDSVRLLKIVGKNLPEGSLIILSSVTDTMIKKDPFSCFWVHLIMGWKFVFKTREDIYGIVRSAGLNPVDFFTDCYGYHGMVVIKT